MAKILLKKGKEFSFSRKPTLEEIRTLNDNLSTDSQRIHAAILAASFLSKESWIKMCYDELALCHDFNICTVELKKHDFNICTVELKKHDFNIWKVELKKIDEFFKNEAIEFLDKECAESCVLGGEKPSEVIGILLKYNF